MPPFRKIIQFGTDFRFLSLYFLTGTVAGVEHLSVLTTLKVDWIADVGANWGQFALVARRVYPGRRIFCFEPQPQAIVRLTNLFKRDPLVLITPVAVGTKSGQALLHISARQDSSSLLPIGKLQQTIFPGTRAVGTISVQVEPLAKILPISELSRNGLLKIDVQGFELEVLRGCADALDLFSAVYVEASLSELYEGQGLLDEIIEFLRSNNFRLAGIHNPHLSSERELIQADFLFLRHEKDFEEK